MWIGDSTSQGVIFGPNHLGQTILSYIHFIKNSLRQPKQHYLHNDKYIYSSETNILRSIPYWLLNDPILNGIINNHSLGHFFWPTLQETLSGWLVIATSLYIPFILSLSERPPLESNLVASVAGSAFTLTSMSGGWEMTLILLVRTEGVVKWLVPLVSKGMAEPGWLIYLWIAVVWLGAWDPDLALLGIVAAHSLIAYLFLYLSLSHWGSNRKQLIDQVSACGQGKRWKKMCLCIDGRITMLWHHLLIKQVCYHLNFLFLLVMSWLSSPSSSDFRDSVTLISSPLLAINLVFLPYLFPSIFFTAMLISSHTFIFAFFGLGLWDLSALELYIILIWGALDSLCFATLFDGFVFYFLGGPLPTTESSSETKSTK